MIVGIFHPIMNWCGGAEWVAINIISTLKKHGHQVVILTHKPLNQDKFAHIFKRKVLVDREIIYPFTVFPPADYHNLYTNAIRSLILKLKCEVLIDTYSNAVLPGTNVSYIHYPLLKRVECELPYLRNKIFFYPYRKFLDSAKKDINNRLFFANSRFTAQAVKAEIGVEPYVLYPPVFSDILNHIETHPDQQRDSIVTTVARISHGKNLMTIPYIAKLTGKETSFIIVGLQDSEIVLSSLLRLIKRLGVSEKVRILTNVERDCLRGILSNSKVYLHPTINEHFGISIVEAMSSGCLPVVHDSGGPREFVPKDLRYKSIEEAAEKVEKAVDSWSPELASRFSKFADGFSENNFSKRFMDVFNSYVLGSDTIVEQRFSDYLTESSSALRIP